MQNASWLWPLIFVAACGGCDDPNNVVQTSDLGLQDVALTDVATPTDDAGGESCAIQGCTNPDEQCDEATGECVECLAATDCDPSAPVCRFGACTGCTTDSQCAMAVADGATVGENCRNDGRCVSCERDADCPDFEPYCEASGLCARCRNDEDCPSVLPICEASACVSCTATDRCTDDERLSELTASRCAAMIALEGTIEDPLYSDLLEGFQVVACSETALDFVPSFGLIRKALAAGRMALNQTAFEACVTGDAAACNDVIEPRIADGDTCWDNAECVSGNCLNQTCPGMCDTASAEGGACANNGDCRISLTCVESVCIKPPGLGQTCSTSCDTGLLCESGVCAPLRAAGGACPFPYYCEEGTYCNSSSVCTDLPQPGETCAEGGRCALGVRCSLGTCQTPQPAGSACSVTAQCETGYRCVDSTCGKVLGPGEICTQSALCALGLGCIDGRCGVLPDVGAPCFEAGGCIRGECDLGTMTCVGLPDGSACDREPVRFDAFDPCGETSTCIDDGTGTKTCVAEGGVGALCGAPNPPCSQPATYCNNSNVCAVVCAAEAP